VGDRSDEKKSSLASRSIVSVGGLDVSEFQRW
jgi:hypothetical protein